MIRRVGRRKFNIMAFDIETHNDAESIEKKETSMWLGCLIDENMTLQDEKTFFYNMEDVFFHLEELVNPKRIKGKRPCKNLCVYVWNLSFEWSFMLPIMLKIGYKFKGDIDWDEDEYVYNTISTRSCSSVWQINIKMKKGSGRLIFKDLSKIYSGSLRKVAKAFNLPTQKGDIDYTENRLHRPKNFATDEEKEYCYKDVKIIMDILEKVGDDKTFWSVVSTASYTFKNALKFAFPRSVKPFQEYRKIYPDLDEKESAFLREGVGGGITYAPDRWQYKEIKNLIHIDLHQAHPSSCALFRHPYGKGTYFKGKPPLEYGQSCVRIRISYSYVKLHCIIQLIGIPFIDDYELVVWDTEIPLMYKCYVDLKVEYIEGYFYKVKPSPFGKYMRHNYNMRLEAKRAGDDYNTMRYKLLNNSFYGKLLEKAHNEVFENTIFENGIIGSVIHEKPLEEAEISGHYAYLPLGSSIPMRTRFVLISTALKFGWKNIVYFDTDSIFMLDNEETRKVLETINLNDELGGWSIEDTPQRASFSCPKRYKLEIDGKTIVKSGGINFDAYMNKRNTEMFGDNKDQYLKLEDVPYDEINIVSSSWDVQRAYRCKGGTLILFQKKEMEVLPKYASIYKNNTKC